MRLLRAAVITSITAAAVLLAPGVAAADGPVAAHDCARVWFWWIPLPCL